MANGAVSCPIPVFVVHTQEDDSFMSTRASREAGWGPETQVSKTQHRPPRVHNLGVKRNQQPARILLDSLHLCAYQTTVYTTVKCLVTAFNISSPFPQPEVGFPLYR